MIFLVCYSGSVDLLMVHRLDDDPDEEKTLVEIGGKSCKLKESEEEQQQSSNLRGTTTKNATPDKRLQSALFDEKRTESVNNMTKMILMDFIT